MFPDSGDHVNLDRFAQRSSYSFLEGVSNQDCGELIFARILLRRYF